MSELLRAGGYPIWIVILFSFLALLAAILFAVRADLKKLALVRAMTAATIFSICAGVLANLLAVMRYVGGEEKMSAGERFHIVLVGFGESITPGILGFSVLSITWLIVAVGTRRVQDIGE